MTTHEEALAHFGVKGMRWGVRKAPGTSAAPSTSSQGKSSPSTRKQKVRENRIAAGKHAAAQTLKVFGVLSVGAAAGVYGSAVVLANYLNPSDEIYWW